MSEEKNKLNWDNIVYATFFVLGVFLGHMGGKEDGYRDKCKTETQLLICEAYPQLERCK